MRTFIIAMPCEAEAVRGALRGTDRLVVCGIGKVNAARATQQAIDAGATEIVNAGLAGGLDPAMSVGDVFSIDRAVQYDFDLAAFGTPAGQLDGRDSPYFPCAPLKAFPARTLATGDRFTDAEDDYALFDALGCKLRDMEGAAIAHVCEANGIPLRMFKCVSNVRGGGSMTGQYAARRDFALARLAAVCADRGGEI